jgi:hypothetical protein
MRYMVLSGESRKGGETVGAFGRSRWTVVAAVTDRMLAFHWRKIVSHVHYA